MAGQHVSRELLVRLLTGIPGLAPGELDGAAHHVLHCQGCWSMTCSTIHELRARGVKLTPGPAFAALVVFADLDRDRPLEMLKAKGRWLWLSTLGPGERTTEMRSYPSLRTWEFMLVILAEADRLSRADPHTVEDVVHFGMQVAELLPVKLPALSNDCRADLWTSLGNARRVIGDWAGAAQAFKRAQVLCEEGSGDPLALARVREHAAAFECDLGRTEAALSMWRHARTLYDSAGDRGAAAKTLIAQANAIRELRPSEALAFVAEALTMLPACEWRSLMLARGIQIEATVEDGRAIDALVLLNEARSIFEQFREAGVGLRVRFLEARILHSLGEKRAAERFYKSIIAGFEDLESYKEAFATRLCLFGFFVVENRLDAAMRLVGESVELLSSLPVHSQMRAVWKGLGERLMARELDVALMQKAREYLARHWRVPASELPFGPSAPVN